VDRNHRTELLQTIQTLLPQIRAEKGCVTFRYYFDPEDENTFVLIGEWDTQMAWYQYLQSEEFSILLGAIDILTELTSVDFKVLTYQGGLESISPRRRCRLRVVQS
jgi:quinol monooxygenase YgiN